MTDLRRQSYRLPDPPMNSEGVRQTWQSYQASLEHIAAQPDGMETLSRLLSEVSEKLQAQTQSTISHTLSEYNSTQDRPVLRSMAKGGPSPSAPDRGARPDPSRAPGPLDLLSSSRRLGPRLASKLVLAEARRQTRSS